MKLRPIFWMSWALIFGILLSRWQILPVVPGAILSIIFCAAALVLVAGTFKKFFWTLLTLGVIIAGWTLSSYFLSGYGVPIAPGPIKIEGTVNSIPVRARSIRNNSRWRMELLSENQKFLLTVPENSGKGVRYGDVLRLEGTVLKNFRAKNSGSFDSEFYLKRSGIAARVSVDDTASVQIISRGQGNPIVAAIYKLKLYFLKQIERFVPFPESSIISAMVLGNRESIPENINEAFVKSGTSHILAISGSNVGLIALLAFTIFRFLRIYRRLSYAATIGVVLSYCILTGGDPSIMRATIMATIYLLGFVFGRRSEPMTALSWSAFLILFFHPLQLFDAGFQLSFITVLFLITSEKLIFGLDADLKTPELLQTKWDRLKLKIQKVLNVGISTLEISAIAWISLVPLLISYFYLFSPITIFANLIAVPWSGIVLTCGLAFLALGSFSHFLASVLGQAVWFFTKIFIWICRFFSQIPYGNFHCGPPSVFDYFIYYLPFALWLFKDYWKWNKIYWQIIILCSLNLLVWKPIFWKNVPQKLEINFLDVGHGDAAFIQFPGQGNLLVDTGIGGDWDQGKLTVAPFLWSQGITHLDGILITHPHFDHYGGLAYLLKEFSVGTVFDNGNRAVPEYEKYFSGANVERKTLNRGDALLGNSLALMEVLHPPKSWISPDAVSPNDQSIVVQLQYGRQTILLSGDAEEKALMEMMRVYPDLKADILKVPHHGSHDHLPGELFFNQVNPKVSIISEAEKNVYGLPSPKTVQILQNLNSRIYQTGIEGAVTYKTDGAQWTAHSKNEANQ